MDLANKNKLIIVLFVLVLINISFISAQKYTLKVTEEHPFFVLNNFVNVMQNVNDLASESEESAGIWKTADELKIGDLLFTDDGKKAKITSIKEVDNKVEVYNLEANPFNDFVVEGKVVVHNSNREGVWPPRSVDEVLGYTDAQRLEYVAASRQQRGLGFDNNWLNEVITARGKTQPRKQFIIDAHNEENIFTKVRILLDAGFDMEYDIPILLETGACGKFKFKCYNYCTGKSPTVRPDVLKKMSASDRAKVNKALSDLSDAIFRDPATGNYVSILERPDIIFDNINRLFGIAGREGNLGEWTDVGILSVNTNYIYIDGAELARISRITDPIKRIESLRELFVKSLIIQDTKTMHDGTVKLVRRGLYRFEGNSGVATWPADIWIRNPDGSVSRLVMDNELHRLLRFWDAAARLEEMTHGVQRFFSGYGDQRNIISPISQEYICWLFRTGQFQSDQGRFPAKVIELLLGSVHESDVLFFFLSNPRLAPIVTQDFIDSHGYCRSNSIYFLNEMYRRGIIDIDPNKIQ